MQPPENTFHTASSNAVAAAEIFSLPFHDQKWRGGAGGFHGSSTGTSHDFHDHRSYVPGDDPRHINWQAFARSGSYTMKLYREEVRPLADIILDVSRSMFATPEKVLRVLELFLFCCFSATRAGAGVRHYLACGHKFVALDPATVFSPGWLAMVPDLENAAPLDISALPVRAAAMRVLITDALFAGDPTPLASALAGRGGRGLALIPEEDSDRSPEWSGTTRFVCSEESTRHSTHKITADFLARYAEAYRRHRALWAGTLARYQVAHSLVPVGAPLATALTGAPVSHEP